MTQIVIRKSFFMNMIKKMAIPIKSRDSSFIFPTIALTVHTNGDIEWIGKSNQVLVWVRAKNIIINPFEFEQLKVEKIPINVSNFLLILQQFENDDEIYFTHDTNQGFDYLVSVKNLERQIARLPTTPLSEVKNIYESVPFRYEKNTEMIMFKNGLVVPEISGTCNMKVFKNLVKDLKMQKKIDKMRFDEKKSVEKKWTLLADYNIKVGLKYNKIQTVAGDEYAKPQDIIVRNRSANDIKGRGKLRFSSEFTGIINVISGEIKFYAVENGPLWIMQNTPEKNNRPYLKIRYLVAPAEILI